MTYLKILIFGDSIALGMGDPEGGWVNRLRKPYETDKLSSQKEEVVIVYNLGISGASSWDIVNRFENEINNRAKDGNSIIVIATGIPQTRIVDGENFSPVSRYKEDLFKLLTLAKKHSDRIIFVGLTSCSEEQTTPVSWDGSFYTNERIIKFDSALAAFCKEHKVQYVKLFDIFQAQQGQSSLFVDGLHPNSDGHQLITDLVKPELDKLIDD